MKYPTVRIGSSKVPLPAVTLCVAAAPVLVMVGLRTMSQRHGPQAANGAEVNANHGSFVVPVLPAPPKESQALAATFEKESQVAFGQSPMINRTPVAPPQPKEPTPVVKVDTTPETPGSTTPAAPPIPTLSVTSIMISKGQPVAVISGRVRHIGDTVANGFTVRVIDGDAGTVEIGDDLGRQATLSLKHRGE